MSIKGSLSKENLDTILVLDFGSQYTQLIARRVRELGVYSEIYPWDIASEKISSLCPKGVILSGGPESVTQENTPRIPEIIFNLDIPILGICYGMQTLAEQNGGSVRTSSKKEFGYAELKIEHSSKIFNGLDADNLDVWMSHGDHVSILPDGFIFGWLKIWCSYSYFRCIFFTSEFKVRNYLFDRYSSVMDIINYKE